MAELSIVSLIQIGLLGWDDMRTYHSLRCTSKILFAATEHPLFAKLLPHQRFHFLRLCLCLQRYDTALDVTKMGGGKSYSSCAVAKNLNCKTVVWGPASSELNWRAAFQHFGLDAEFISYSRTNAKNIPYLTKTIQTTPGKRQVVFSSKPEWQQVRLLILDEIHLLINPGTDRSVALECLVKEMHRKGKVLGLSGTPLHNVQQTTRLARLLRIVKQEPLARMNLQTGLLVPIGIQDCFDLCKKLEPNYQPPNLQTHQTIEILHQCLSTVVKRHLFFAMPPILNSPYTRVTYNLTMNITIAQESQSQIDQGMRKIDIAIGLMQQYGNANRLQAMSVMQKGLEMVELGKAQLFVEFARFWLRQDPMCKVLLMVNYMCTLEILKQELAEFDPIIISHKSTTLQRRNRLRSEFQEHNDRRRLLCSTTALLATGCDLDDQSEGGLYPRYMGVSPGYNAHSQQIGARVERQMTTSVGQVYYLFSEHLGERRFLRNMQRKTTFNNSMLHHKLTDCSSHVEINFTDL